MADDKMKEKPKSKGASALYDAKKADDTPEPVKKGAAKPADEKPTEGNEPAAAAKSDDAAEADPMSKVMDAFKNLAKSHENERRDMHGNHREEMRQMMGRHEKAFKDLSDMHMAGMGGAQAAPIASESEE